ncbi:MAG: hypothetical protein FJX77_09120 [Armatimonadetes bacterium]|nr:hypothetical protein [Armatimonadota bacterium]
MRVGGDLGFCPHLYASSPHGCQARILQTLGVPLTYQDLICYGGFAFRIQVHERLCPSAGHPRVGTMCVENSDRAIGWETRFFESFPWTSPKADRAAWEAEAHDAIRESVLRGVPVHYGSEEDGLIVGCSARGDEWECLHPYHADGRERFLYEEATGFAGGAWPWGIAVWTRPSPERLEERELLCAALRQAVTMAADEAAGDFRVGDAGYEHWLAWLHGLDQGSLELPEWGRMGNAWCFAVLIHCRGIAGSWLAEQAERVPAAAAAELRTAAGCWSESAAALAHGLQRPSDLAPGPGSGANWTTTMRAEQRRRLDRARAADAEAVAALDRALAWL